MTYLLFGLRSDVLPRLLLLLTLAGPAFGWWDTWPYLEHQDLLDRTIDICAERYPDLAAEVDARRDDMLSGTHDEDIDEDQTNGSYCDYSGYCPTLPSAWWPTARRRLNAIQWVHDPLNPNHWAAAVATYQSSKSDAYYMLGHVLHNLQDLFVAAHASIAPHGSGTSGLVENHSWPLYVDNFEQYCEVTDNELDRARADRIPEAGLDSLMVRAAVFSTTNADSVGFRPTDYYAPPDTAGGWGRYRPYPSGGYPCGNDRIDNSLANSWSLWVVPACCEVTAAAIRAFWLECQGVGSAERRGTELGRLALTSPCRPGLALASSATPLTAAFISPDGRVAASAAGTTLRCPDLAPGVWLVRITSGTRAAVRPLVVTR